MALSEVNALLMLLKLAFLFKKFTIVQVNLNTMQIETAYNRKLTYTIRLIRYDKAYIHY